MISIDTEAGILSVPGASGHEISAAFEDARAAHVSSDITDMVQEAADLLDDNLDKLLSSADLEPVENNESPAVAEGRQSPQRADYSDSLSALDLVGPLDPVAPSPEHDEAEDLPSSPANFHNPDPASD